jgi:hypothetical protein
LRLLEIGAVAEVDPDKGIGGRALDAAVAAGDQKIANPGQVGRQAGAKNVAALADATGGGADIGGGFQDGLDRRDDFALGIGAVLGKTGKFGGGERNLPGAGILEGTGAIEHQGRHQNHGDQRKPRADSKKLLEFEPLAVETDAGHL